MTPDAFLPASLADPHPLSVRGRVDLASPREGVVGWLVDTLDPASRRDLRLLAGDRVLAEATTSLVRDEVGGPEGAEAIPRFRFPPTSFRALLDDPAADRLGRLRIQDVGTGLFLRGAEGLAPLPASVDGVAAAAPESAGLHPHGLLPTLGERRDLARALLPKTFRPQAGLEAGYVEMLAPVAAGFLLIVGWLREERPIDMPAVVIADAKHAAGLAGLTFRRADLGEGAVGFAALARTDWRPTPGAPFVLAWEADEPRFAPGVPDLRHLGAAEAKRWLSTLSGAAPPAALAELEANLASLEALEPAKADADALGIRFGLDRVLLLPGFGAMAEGWLLSPMRRVRDWTLRLGDETLPGDPRAFSTKSRPDIAAGFVDAVDLAASAGFAAAFRGSRPLGGLGSIAVRARLEDDTALVLPVDPRVVRLVADRDGFQAMAALWPSLAVEPFLPSLMAACGRSVREAAAAVTVIVADGGPRAVALALPRWPDEIAVAVDALVEGLPTLAPDVGVVLLASSGHDRRRVLSAADAIRRHARRAVGVAEAAGEPYAPWSLPALLRRLGCGRAWFVGPASLPTARGWKVAAAWFEKPDPPPLRFGSSSPAGREADPSPCFAASAREIERWAGSAPFLFGGVVLEGFTEAGPGTVRALGAAEPSPVLRGCDERALRERPPAGASAAP